MLESIELNNTKEKVEIKSDGKVEFSFDELLEISEEILKARDEKELDKGIDLDRYDDKKELNLARQGGVYNISPYELEQMSGEYSEINNILAMAKADEGVKQLLLTEIVSEFKTELYNYFDEYNRIEIADKQIEDIIEGVTEIINENIQVEGVRFTDNIESYGFVPKEQMKDTVEWIKKKMGL